MGRYPKKPYETGSASAVLYPGRKMDRVAVVKAKMPCTVIVIHGVNDVGVSYGAVEAGLCAGMTRRLMLPPGAFVPNNYRDFTDADRDRLEDDPDAVFFKRTPTPNSHSFVIPFYWGYRELSKPVAVKNGQYVDRYGNRLDKDYSKEGGPFANATNSLPDMWNEGFGGIYGLIDWKNGDPLRPVVDAPGHMYMVLAAKRMAALVQMIRDFDPDETVNIVAHSQGCMVSLLAQAFLLQDGHRPVDTLVINNPPYSLEDDLPMFESIGNRFKAGRDKRMEEAGDYKCLRGVQTLHARLQTLANIVRGVGDKKHTQPEFHTLNGPQGCTVGTKWSPGADRDNRGKVYLYFSPEDATVALNIMRGIGWQGVPDFKTGGQFKLVGKNMFGKPLYKVQRTEFSPLGTIGPHFAQRVFTRRLRAPATGGEPTHVFVGAPAPHDFALCLKGEEGFVHVNDDSRSRRGELKTTEWPETDRSFHPSSREGIRRITGETLARPVKAELVGTSLNDGRSEKVDALDAAIAVTSDNSNARDIWQLMPAASRQSPFGLALQMASPCPSVFSGMVAVTDAKQQASDVVNAGKTTAEQKREVVGVYACLQSPGLDALGKPDGRWLVHCKESIDDIRVREQNTVVSRSYHSAIFSSAFNHEHVTAYDLSIGQGKAVSDPKFRAYLCAVADWRLKQIIAEPDKPAPRVRPGIMAWDDFISRFSEYYSAGVESEERMALIKATSDYYSKGVLPDFLPVIPSGLPPAVVSEISGIHEKGVNFDQSMHLTSAHAPASGVDAPTTGCQSAPLGSSSKPSARSAAARTPSEAANAPDSSFGDLP